MDNDPIDILQIKIEKAKAELSNDTLNAINAVDWKTAILKMREKNGYSFEQLGALETETELVLCGLLSPKDYPKELENRMGISKIRAEELVKEMNEEVFTKIKEELIKNTERKNIFAVRSPTIERPVQNGFIRPNTTEAREEIKKNTQVLGEHGIEIVSDIPVAPGAHTLQAEKLELTTTMPATPSQTIIEEKKTQDNLVVVVPQKTATTPEVPNIPIPSILTQKFSGPVSVPSVKTEHTLPNLSPSNIPAPKPPITKPAIDPYREIPE